MALNLHEWDASEYLDNPEIIAEYLQAAMEENDPALFRAALADIAKAKGMTAIAEQAQLNRQSLYKSLSANGNPSFDSITKLLNALGLKIQVIGKGIDHVA